MSRVYKYLDKLEKDKQLFVDILNSKDITSSSEETFSTLVPKVNDMIIDPTEKIYDVILIDFTGTEVAMYLKEDFLKLTELPTPPEYDGLVFQEWNWTLEEAKEFMQDHDTLVIGALYTTVDGKTKMTLHLEEGDKLNPGITLRLYENIGNEVYYKVSWGDGTFDEKTDIVSFNTYKDFYLNHKYETYGDYEITIETNDGVYFSAYSGGQRSGLLHDPITINISSSDASYYISRLTDIKLGSNFILKENGIFCDFVLPYINIPSNNYPSYKLGRYCFQDTYSRTNLKCLVLPRNIIGNDYGTFQNTLTYLSISKNFTDIYLDSDGIGLRGHNIKYLTDTLLSNNKIVYTELYSIRKFKIPSHITSIPVSYLQNNKYIKEIVIPSRITTIERYAFQNFKGNIIFEDSYNITYFGQNSLEGTSIESININKSAKLDTGFKECYNLKRLDLSESNITSLSYTFQNCYNLETVTLPKTLTSISYNVFHNCNKLEVIEIPSSVTSISSSAGLNYCKSLKTVIFNSSLPRYVLSGCRQIKNVILNEGVVSLDSYSFNDCRNISKLEFPSTFKDMSASDIFSQAQNLNILDFSKCTEIVKLGSNTFGYDSMLYYAKQGYIKDYDAVKIIVPKHLFNSWIVSDNWNNTNLKKFICYIDDNGNYSKEEVVE